MTPDFEVEIELPACRCRLPHPMAEVVAARFEADSLKVSRSGSTAAGAVELAVMRVKVLRFRVSRTGALFNRAEAASEARSVDLTDDYFVAGEHVERLAAGMLRTMMRGDEQRAPAPSLLTPKWLPVFDVRSFTRTGAELLVVDDVDASRQLDVLAVGMKMPREAITIKPRRGWQGYGRTTVR